MAAASASIDHASSEFGELAAWVCELDFDGLPATAVERIRQSVRDGLGCALYGSTLPWSQIVAEAVASQGSGAGRASIFGSGVKVDAIGAAIANGTAVQAYELDDMHGEASIHGSSTMLPSTLALAELRGGVTGRELIVALAAGWEVGLRLHRCVGNLLALGWHPPTIMGTLAAAAAAGRLLRLSSEQMFHCLSLAALQASGLTVVQYGGMAKRLYAGRAAEIGVQSALFAERGFTAPEQALEHPVGGFLATFGHDREPRLAALNEGLGQEFSASSIGFKLYSCCGAGQPALDLLVDLVAEYPDIRDENIEHIDIALTDYGFKHVGFPYVPDNATTAQFSVIYAFAAYLTEGAVFIDQFRDDLLDDPRILRLVERIEAKPDKSLEGPNLMHRRASRVTVRLRDGQTLTKEGYAARGHPDRPATDDELYAKFERLATSVLDETRAVALSDATQALDTLDDVAELVGLLSP